MNFFNELMYWYLTVIKKYAVFEGRARRREFWMFVLANVIVSVALGILSRLPVVGALLGIASALYGLAIFVPSLAVGARRLHDTGRSGWLMLIALIPLVGAVILIVFAAQDSASGSNQYGPNPKAAKLAKVEMFNKTVEAPRPSQSGPSSRAGNKAPAPKRPAPRAGNKAPAPKKPASKAGKKPPAPKGPKKPARGK